MVGFDFSISSRSITVNGCFLMVHFGSTAPGSRVVYPLDAEQRAKTFHLLGFVDARGLVAAKGFPVTDDECAEWDKRLVEEIINRGK